MKNVCIVCGGGSYPLLTAQECIKKNINVCLIFLKGFYNANYAWPDVNKIELNLGEVGAALKFTHENNVDTVVMAGNVTRPEFGKMSLDSVGVKWLAKLGFAIFQGDDALLKAVADLFRQEGMEIIAGTDLLDGVFLEDGIFTNRIPSEDEIESVKIGFNKAKDLGKRDLGQSVVVKGSELIAEENELGTEQLIKISGELLKNSNGGGILVKVSKPQQDLRLDLPTIGVDTIDQLHKANFNGIAIESGKCIVLNKKEVISRANEYNLFVAGCGLNFSEVKK